MDAKTQAAVNRITAQNKVKGALKALDSLDIIDSPENEGVLLAIKHLLSEAITRLD